MSGSNIPTNSDSMVFNKGYDDCVVFVGALSDSEMSRRFEHVKDLINKGNKLCILVEGHENRWFRKNKVLQKSFRKVLKDNVIDIYSVDSLVINSSIILITEHFFHSRDYALSYKIERALRELVSQYNISAVHFFDRLGFVSVVAQKCALWLYQDEETKDNWVIPKLHFFMNEFSLVKEEYSPVEILNRHMRSQCMLYHFDMRVSSQTIALQDIWFKPLVSIIIPYYEMGHYIEETLISIAKSSYSNWEIIVIDDGSHTKTSIDCFDQLKERFKNNIKYKFMRQANGGLGNARNSGIKVAKGKYILPLDADDLLSDNYIEATIKVLEENDIFSYVSSFGGCFRDGKGIDRLCEWSTPYGLCHDLLYFENGAGLATSLFRAAVFEDFHYDETLTAYEDWDFFMQLSVAGKSGIVIPEVLFYYRLRGTSMLRNIGQPNHIPLLRAMTSKQGRAGNLSQELKQALAHFYDEYQKSTGGNVVVADENEILKNNDEVGQSEVILDVRDFYLKWLKGPLYDVFPEHRARRIVNIIKSLLYRIFG